MSQGLEKMLKSPETLAAMLPPLPEPPPLSGDLREAATLLLLDHGGLWFLKRSLSMRRHPGQIAFPGGRREREDADLWQTAQRETFEEMGADPSAISFLGALPWLVTPTGYRVHPYLGWWHNLPLQPVLNEEAEFAFRVEVGDLRNAAAPGERARYPTPAGEIWGATAMMLHSWLRMF